ncbi:hypothetical protein [Campylobacter fetus]|uniref:hypothetical protein n=1 Tax=Campylobacter fetus TaxID=196 RepID=UPI00163B9116|nr:hypothetical protein [Campylobacter fetus]
MSDHIISQMQNIARVNQASKYGVTHYKVVARIDSRTSDICRSMNGRIIPASHIERQSNNIQNAKSISEKKGAAIWRNEPFLGKMLPSNFGLPPYHFRCRTELVPVWIDSEEIDGVTMTNTSSLNKDEVVKHIDKTGVERVLDFKARYGNHGLKERFDNGEISQKDIVKALNSINKIAPSKHNEKLFNTISDNGIFMVFDGNRIVTAFRQDRDYFKQNSITLRQEIIKSNIFTRWFK